MILWEKYQSTIWLQDARTYLNNRQYAIRDRLIDTFRFVELHQENHSVFSYEYASLLRDCGSVFSSVLDAVFKGINNTQANTRFADYRRLLLSEDPDIYRRSVLLVPAMPNGIVVPFARFHNNNTPSWWTAYNNIKHSEYENFRQGCLGSVVTALAALKLIDYLLGRTGTDGLWANIGIAYPDNSIDMSAQRRIFPKSE